METNSPNEKLVVDLSGNIVFSNNDFQFILNRKDFDHSSVELKNATLIHLSGKGPKLYRVLKNCVRLFKFYYRK